MCFVFCALHFIWYEYVLIELIIQTGENICTTYAEMMRSFYWKMFLYVNCKEWQLCFIWLKFLICQFSLLVALDIQNSLNKKIFCFKKEEKKQTRCCPPPAIRHSQRYKSDKPLHMLITQFRNNFLWWSHRNP